MPLESINFYTSIIVPLIVRIRFYHEKTITKTAAAAAASKTGALAHFHIEIIKQIINKILVALNSSPCVAKNGD